MGLDIIVYSKLEHQRDERVEEVMESLFSPLGEEIIEICEEEENRRCSDMAIGKWHRTDATQEAHLRAGSYSGYNQSGYNHNPFSNLPDTALKSALYSWHLPVRFPCPIIQC